MEKITVRTRKPRNPFVVPSMLRKAGEHDKRDTRKRKLAQVRWKEAGEEMFR